MCSRTVYCTNIDKKVYTFHKNPFVPNVEELGLGHAYMALLNIWNIAGSMCRFLKLKSRISLKQLVVRWGKVLFIICSFFWSYFTSSSNWLSFFLISGYSFEAFGRSCAFNSYSFCWICNGKFKLTTLCLMKIKVKKVLRYVAEFVYSKVLSIYSFFPSWKNFCHQIIWKIFKPLYLISGWSVHGFNISVILFYWFLFQSHSVGRENLPCPQVFTSPITLEKNMSLFFRLFL